MAAPEAALVGRVFARQRQFPAEASAVLQADVALLQAHLTATQDKVFGPHHASLVRVVKSVRGKPLVEHIVKWLAAREAPEAPPNDDADNDAAAVASSPSADSASGDSPAQQDESKPEAVAEAAPADAEAPAPADGDETTAPADEAPAPASAEAEAPADAAAAAKAEAKAEAKAAADALARRRVYAKELVEALVHVGYITPNKDHDKLATTDTHPYYRDHELFIPLAADVTELAPDVTTTVWDVADAGATLAGYMKRKAGFLAPLTPGKDVYVVLHETRRTLYLFESDVARSTIATFNADDTQLAMDHTHFTNGVKLWNTQYTELLHPPTKRAQEALVDALVKLGMRYTEAPTPAADAASLYAFKDTALDGTDVSLDAYKGKVVVVVNVASKCGLTAAQYAGLVDLDRTYHEQGLVILAFPCNQFGAQEFETADEIKSFVESVGASFPVFRLDDVNGGHARDVFMYLKSKLPGPSGTYVPWNFTKFVIDRRGQPRTRYEPSDAPSAMEDEIVALLAEVVEDEHEDESKDEEAAAAADDETTEETVETVVTIENGKKRTVVTRTIVTTSFIEAHEPAPAPASTEVVAATEGVVVAEDVVVQEAGAASEEVVEEVETVVTETTTTTTETTTTATATETETVAEAVAEKTETTKVDAPTEASPPAATA